jgi:hypothetical protein
MKNREIILESRIAELEEEIGRLREQSRRNITEVKRYRVGRKIGLVILETETSKEVARATTEEMAKNICELLNWQCR